MEATPGGKCIMWILVCALVWWAVTAQESVKPIQKVRSVWCIGKEGTSVLALLQKDHDVEFNEEGRVISIDDVNKSPGWWLYRVNGGIKLDSANECLTRDGQIIEWR